MQVIKVKRGSIDIVATAAKTHFVCGFLGVFLDCWMKNLQLKYQWNFFPVHEFHIRLLSLPGKKLKIYISTFLFPSYFFSSLLLSSCHSNRFLSFESKNDMNSRFYCHLPLQIPLSHSLFSLNLPSFPSSSLSSPPSAPHLSSYPIYLHCEFGFAKLALN